MVKSIRSFAIISTAFALMLSLSTALWGGVTGKISGRIVDEATGEPLAGANVMIVGTALGAAADAEGDYFIINVPPGTYEVQASMIGYQAVTLTEIIVRIDLTTPLDFNLTSTVVVGEAVTVTAEREIVKMDESASVVNASITEIVEVPMVTDMTDYMSLQAGILGDEMRGGGLDQQGLMVDGLLVVDNRTNTPILSVNLSSIKEMNIILGGFNAEYGNVRSGMINVVTKEGDPTRYHGSIDLRYRTAGLKHDGPSVFDPMNWHLRPYLDPDVAFDGTWAIPDTTGAGAGALLNDPNTGYWNAYQKQKYNAFVGWNQVAADPKIQEKYPGITAEELQQIFKYQHGIEGYAGQPARTYGDKPDLLYDLSLGGPVPIIGRFLGDMSFFLSHRTDVAQFVLPTTRPDYKEVNTQFKLTSRLTPRVKLHLEGAIGKIYSMSTSRDGNVDSGYQKGADNLWRGVGWPGPGDMLYWPEGFTAFTVDRKMFGFGLDHTLSARTFYNIRVSYVNVANHNDLWSQEDYRYGFYKGGGNTALPDTTLEPKLVIKGFELWGEPYGMTETTINLLGDGMFVGGDGGGSSDSGYVNTISAKFDITSQVNKYNQFKAGVEFVTDELNTKFYHTRYESTWENRKTVWSYSPYRLAAYIQDKLEFEGMVANIGIRMDYSNPNADWFDFREDPDDPDNTMKGPYSDWFRLKYKEEFQDEAPRRPVEGQLHISPRVGITHPISENAKLYFNYGHFYSMPNSTSMYRIEFGNTGAGITGIGNAEALIPRTVSYELGVDANVAGLARFRIGGYYKNVTDQPGDIRYESYDGGVRYRTTDNKNYADIRGLEIRVDRRFGRWISGWVNYDYLVESSGNIGRWAHYQDPNRERKEGFSSRDQDRPLPRPAANGYLSLFTPSDFGPGIAGINPLGDLNASFIWSWRAGWYVSWDPLGLDLPENNLQTKGRHRLDLRIQKSVRLGQQRRITFFADINNVLDLHYINDRAFDPEVKDEETYRESLHLPMYKDVEYSRYWYEMDPEDGSLSYVYPKGFDGEMPETPDGSERRAVEFNDQLGDLGGPGTDKPYINMPNRDFMQNKNIRYITFGLQVSF